MQSHIKYTITSILKQRSILLNQLRKQGLGVSGLTQIFMALVVSFSTHSQRSLVNFQRMISENLMLYLVNPVDSQFS